MSEILETPSFSLVPAKEARTGREARELVQQENILAPNAVADWLLNAASLNVKMALDILTGRKIVIFSDDSARIIEMVDDFLHGGSEDLDTPWDPDAYVAVRGE